MTNDLTEKGKEREVPAIPANAEPYKCSKIH